MDTVVALLAFIQSVTGYALPSYAPQIARVDHARIADMILCEGPCEAFAYYKDGVVYIDRDADVEHDLKARSILLHELTHWLQDANCAFCGVAAGAYRWRLREADAYETQSKYLFAASGAPVRFTRFADPEEVAALRAHATLSSLAKSMPASYSVQN
jgi:hypothetical protein